MKRINIYSYDEVSAEKVLEGWFDDDKAEKFEENTEWDGNNHISVATGSQWDHQILLRTAKGRWVLNDYSNRSGVMESYAFVTDVRAREWLLINGHDDAVAEHFGEVEEERGPGRPEVGAAINVRLSPELLAQVDQHAANAGIARAAAIRQLLTDALAAAV